MAQDTQINITLKYSKSPASAQLGTSYTTDQVGNKYEGGVQSIATSETTLQKGGIGTIGYMGIRNLDLVNYIDVGSVTAQLGHRIPAGKGMIAPWGQSNVIAQANTSAVLVEYLLIEA